MSDDRRGWCGVVIADVVYPTGPRPLHRRDQHACQIGDMDARENVAWLADAPRGAGAQCVESAAAGTVDRSEAEYVDRQAAIMPKIEPALFGGNPTPTALAGWPKRGGFGYPAAATIAIHSGRRQIAQPSKRRQPRDIAGVAVEHWVARGIGGNRNEQMSNPGERVRVDRAVAIEENSREAGLAQQSLPFRAAAGTDHRPPRGRGACGERPRAVT